MEYVDVLVVDDEEAVARSIERTLRGHEFKITVANSGVQALQAARRKPPAIMLLDVTMPGMDGFAVCREVRADPILNETPILFLTARSRDEEKLAGFRAGADDYLTKPFNIDELLMRVRAILRRSKQSGGKPGMASTNGNDSHLIRVQTYSLDTRAYKLAGPRGEIQLTPVQYDLLYHLMSHPGQIFSPNRLLQEVWDYPSDAGSPDLVRVHIKNLRERVEADPRSPSFIRTVPGHGYMVASE